MRICTMCPHTHGCGPADERASSHVGTWRGHACVRSERRPDPPRRAQTRTPEGMPAPSLTRMRAHMHGDLPNRGSAPATWAPSSPPSQPGRVQGRGRESGSPPSPHPGELAVLQAQEQRGPRWGGPADARVACLLAPKPSSPWLCDPGGLLPTAEWVLEIWVAAWISISFGE